jgi:hypothetical protein
MKYLLLLLLPFVLAACNERYRYPCQDPENWGTKECTKPFCSANGTCPEDLKHYEKDKEGKQVQTTNFEAPKKGECK